LSVKPKSKQKREKLFLNSLGKRMDFSSENKKKRGKLQNDQTWVKFVKPKKWADAYVSGNLVGLSQKE